MSTHITTSRHFRLYGAALAMATLLITLLAVTLSAGPTMAQDAGGIVVPPDPRTGNNEDFYSEPYPCSEEAQPDASTVKVIRGSTAEDAPDFYAVFDAFWDYEVGHLSDNFCPPKVTVTTETKENDDGDEVEVTVYTRSDANIHISETAFSVPDSYQVTVIDSRPETPAVGNPENVEGPTIDLKDYPFLAEAVSAVEPDPYVTVNPPPVFANTKVWWVRLDEPGTTADETSDLKIGFSSALMKDGDWHNPNGDAVQFHFGAVHVLVEGAPVETHVVGADFFAFEQRKRADEVMELASWSNLETASSSEINMAVGQYRPMQFLFTKPGEYLVQGQIQGHVRKQAPEGALLNWKPINPGNSVTSPTEWYKFHVGPQADVGVTLTHTDETPTDDTTTVTDGTASFSVTVTNNGPATANEVRMEVELPVGLDYKANSARVGDATTAPSSGFLDYACGIIWWRTGDLTSGQSVTLTFDATVGTGGPKSLTVGAEVHSSTVDEIEANDTASVVVVTNSTVVTPPFFSGVSRDIVEHAVAGTHAGDPVAANNPDGRALTYTLSGRCSDWFHVHSHGQIVLAANKTLNYDKQRELPLTLHVSDGVNASGNADTAIDDSIPVTINVIDTPANTSHPTINFSSDPVNPEAGDQVRVWARVTGLTFEDGSPWYCLWQDENGGRISESYDGNCHVDLLLKTAGTQRVYVHVKWETGGMTATTSVTWSESTN